MKTRKEIVEMAKRQRQEIAQYFVDCEHWNTSVRKPNEEPIEADPDGSMTKMAAALDQMLEKEKSIPMCGACGHAIRFNGEMWEHVDTKPRHNAVHSAETNAL